LADRESVHNLGHVRDRHAAVKKVVGLD
jgi:hypothetical protein